MTNEWNFLDFIQLVIIFLLAGILYRFVKYNEDAESNERDGGTRCEKKSMITSPVEAVKMKKGNVIHSRSNSTEPMLRRDKEELVVLTKSGLKRAMSDESGNRSPALKPIESPVYLTPVAGNENCHARSRITKMLGKKNHHLVDINEAMKPLTAIVNQESKCCKAYNDICIKFAPVVNYYDDSSSITCSLESKFLAELYCDRHVPFHCFASRTSKGYSPVENLKLYNQDTLLHMPIFENIDNVSLFGVLDGHGALGHLVADFVRTEVQKLLITYQSELSVSPRTTLNKIFEYVSDLLEDSDIDISLSGSTAIFCLIIGDQIWSAHVGDSRAILVVRSNDALKMIPLTHDHKPEGEERRRILLAGGQVHRGRGENVSSGALRVWLGDQMVPGLAMSRCFGDEIGQRAGVISEPDIVEHPYVRNFENYLIIASDGIWDALSNEFVAEYLDKSLRQQPHDSRLDLQTICDNLVAEANLKILEKQDSSDDTSIVVVHLNSV